MLKQTPLHYLVVVVSLILYLVMGYEIARHETVSLFAGYFSIFLLYLLALRSIPNATDRDLNFWIGASIIFRLALVFSVPALSDDFYRFLWDGRLLAAGYHPFAEVPSYYMSGHVAIPGIDAELFNKLNSRETFTVYPPVAQSIFWLSVVLSGGTIYGSMIAMKVIVFMFELATLWMLTRVLRLFNQSPAGILIYALNPLVILELTGNLHYEGIMVFFLLSALYLLKKQQQLPSAFAYALSICTKLIPLVFIPLLIRYLGWKKSFIYATLIAVMTALLFLPLLDAEIIEGFATSLRYYFQRFEFNASVYYLIREAGFLIFGFNVIQFSGPLLGVIATLIILYIAFRNFPSHPPGNIDIRFFSGILWSLFAHFILTTILHPWYIITLLAVSIMTPYRFPIVWTGAIFLTYAGYTETGFIEKLPLVALEYIIVIAYLIYENVWKRQRDPS
jgi:alpha-1,6-mannosyltransferase